MSNSSWSMMHGMVLVQVDISINCTAVIAEDHCDLNVLMIYNVYMRCSNDLLFVIAEGHCGLGVLPDGTEADVTLRMSANLLVELLAQRIRPFDAYMDGRLTVSGDLRSAMRLGELIKLVSTGTVPPMTH